jgi:outer membrane protein OmpA-like peptidoglycan-associated protein
MSIDTMRRLIAAAFLLGLGACTQGRVVLLDSGKPSAVTFTNKTGETDLSQPGAAISIAGRNSTPKPIALSQAEIDKTWGEAIANHPPAPVITILYFVLDTTELTPASRAELPKVLRLIKQRPAPEVAIVGYTDRSGETDYNYDLGLRRAIAVQGEVEKIGVPHDAITVNSYGSRNPLVPTRQPYEPRNRRVEITVR